MAPRPRSKLHARIGARVRALRQARGLTQAAVAAQVDCSNHFVSGIERGVDSPSLLTLEKVAAVLGTTVATLVDEEERPRYAVDALALALRGHEDPRLLRVLREVAGLYRPERRGQRTR